MRKLLFGMSAILSLVLVTSAAWGACHVMTPNGSGTKSGSDWNNACAGLSGACSPSSGMVRGDTYFIAKGTYSSATWSRSNSGSATITVKSPTAADHCTDTGFNQSTHVGQALIQGSNFIDSDNWIINGQYGTPFVKGSYGIKFQWNGGNVDSINCRTGCDSSTFQYMEIQGSNYANSYCDEGIGIFGYNRTPNPSNILLDHLYAYQSSNNVKFNSSSNITLQNSILDENYSNGNCHGENIAFHEVDNLVVRYNLLKNCVGTACIATPNACNSTCGTSNNFQAYGNVIYNTRSGSCTANGGSETCTSSLIRVLLGEDLENPKFYNNTFANWSAGLLSSGNVVDVFYNSSAVVNGLEMKNNLFYNNGPIELGDSGGTSCSSNSYYDTKRNSTACSGDQIASGNPLVDPMADFRLTADTAIWTPLGAPYNLDPNNITRVSSRGAYQFGNIQLPDPPSGLAATVR
jgi:hypothetical protein